MGHGLPGPRSLARRRRSLKTRGMNGLPKRKGNRPFTKMADPGPLPTWPPARVDGRRGGAGPGGGGSRREPSGAAPPRTPHPPPRSIPDWSGSSAAARRPRRGAAPGARHFRRVGAVGRGRPRGASGWLRDGRAQGCSGGRWRRPCGLRRRGQRGPPGLFPEPAARAAPPRPLQPPPLQPRGRARSRF